MPKIPGLQLRRKTYHVRVRVPQDLDKFYKSAEIIRSLKTRDYSEASRAIHIVRAQIESEFKQKQEDKKANQDMLSEYSNHDLQALSLRWLDAEKRIRNAEVN